MISSHSSKQYDHELDTIRTRVLQMAAMVEGQFAMAVDSFFTEDCDKARQVIKFDSEVNKLEVLLDDACNHVIVRRQPTANDLRMVMATVKAITDLERIGDEASKIARNAISVADRKFGPANLRDDLEVLAAEVAEILHESLDAFACMDSIRAAALIAKDERVDLEFRDVMRRLITSMTEDPRSISTRLDTLWTAKALERIGDHAKNIAEYVVFVVMGHDIRHASIHTAGLSNLAATNV